MDLLGLEVSEFAMKFNASFKYENQIYIENLQFLPSRSSSFNSAIYSIMEDLNQGLHARIFRAGTFSPANNSVMY